MVASYVATTCETPVVTYTDSSGRFTLRLATGYPPCTVCACFPGVPQTCDPTQAFWFKVVAGSNSAEFVWQALGYGLEGPIRLACDVKSDVRSEVPPSAGPKSQLPRLKCNLPP